MLNDKTERKRRSFTLEDLQQHAASLGGKCLSKKYVNSTYKMLFECKEEHRWKASALMIFGKKNSKGSWCHKCLKTKSHFNKSSFG
jgi:hypothetical protein